MQGNRITNAYYCQQLQINKQSPELGEIAEDTIRDRCDLVVVQRARVHQSDYSREYMSNHNCKCSYMRVMFVNESNTPGVRDVMGLLFRFLKCNNT